MTRSVLGGLDDHADLPARVEAAAALRRLGHALVAHRADPATLNRIAATADSWAETITQSPHRSRLDEYAQRAKQASGHHLGDLVEDGAFLDLFHDSPISGSANPMGVGLRLTRQGDTAVGIGRISAAFEGAPGRAHGGVVAACVDETMGALLPIIGTMAFTGTLSLRYLAPCPLYTDVEFTSWLDRREGRKLHIRTTGRSEQGVFIEADAVFIAIDVGIFAAQTDDPT